MFIGQENTYGHRIFLSPVKVSQFEKYRAASVGLPSWKSTDEPLKILNLCYKVAFAVVFVSHKENGK
jgi:hypothetical protein